MSVIDDLQILITADSSGIDSVLKKTLQTVQGTVNGINSEEVDWTSIFTASVSPAIIAGVASTFAFAISNAVQFQAALATTGTAAGDSTNQISQLSQASLGLSTQVPASAQSIADAMTQVSAIFSSTADQQAVVAAMAELQASGFGDLNDIASSSIQIFKDFGVTTSSQAVAVLTDLMHAAEGAKESIPALAEQFIPFDTQFVSAGANVGSLNGLLATFAGEIQSVGSANATQIFQALATSVNNPVGPMELLGQSIEQVRSSLVNNGALAAISTASTEMEKLGPDAQLVATAFGFSASQVSVFQENAKNLPQVAIDSAAVATNGQTIGDAYKSSDNELRTLQIDWNTFVASLIPVGDIILKGLNSLVSGQFFGLTNAITGAITSAVNGAESLVSKLGSSVKDAVNGNSNLSNVTNSTITGLLQQYAPGISSNQISQIETQASNSNVLTQLLGALNSGLATSSSNYSAIKNTFNLSIPNGKGLTAQQLAQELYSAFQGTGS